MPPVRPGGPWQRGQLQEQGSVVCTLPSQAAVLQVARQLIRTVCRRWPDGDACEAVLLTASELLGNAVTAASGPCVRLRLAWTSRRVRVEVGDRGVHRPQVRTADELAEGGRGLWLVEQVAVRWGSQSTPDGTCVWAEIALTPG